jgi:heat shock protein HtpX
VRRVLLTLVAGVNHLILVSVFAGGLLWLGVLVAAGIFWPTWTPRFGHVVASSLAVGLICLVVLTILAMRELPTRVSGGIGVRHPRPAELRLTEVVAELAIATGMEAPDVGIIDSVAPNALAIGVSPRRTSIVVTSGLLALLTRDELEAVLAAEMIATARLDVAVRTLAAIYARGNRATYASWIPPSSERSPLMWPWVVLLGPTQLVTRWVWRSVLVASGPQCDALAVAVTRNPEALLHALEKVRTDHHVLNGVPLETVPMWIESEDVNAREAGLLSAPSALGLLDRRIQHLVALCGDPPPAS